MSDAPTSWPHWLSHDPTDALRSEAGWIVEGVVVLVMVVAVAMVAGALSPHVGLAVIAGGALLAQLPRPTIQ